MGKRVLSCTRPSKRSSGRQRVQYYPRGPKEWAFLQKGPNVGGLQKRGGDLNAERTVQGGGGEIPLKVFLNLLARGTTFIKVEPTVGERG